MTLFLILSKQKTLTYIYSFKRKSIFKLEIKKNQEYNNPT